MRLFGKTAVAGVIAALLTMLPAVASAENLIPSKRLVLSENTDLPGGDLASIFDTTLEPCQRACLSNKSCTAFTFNTRNGSCFVKSGQGSLRSFKGPIRVLF